MTRAVRTRTTVRRLPDKQVPERAALDALLDAALVAHVAVLDPGSGSGSGSAQPYVLPMAFARDGDRLLVHGSTASRTLRWLATGAASCATVTVVDAVLVARSQFESSYHYRSAMILGAFEALHGREKERALGRLASRLLPGLTGARTPSAQELAATAVLALPLGEWSLKVSDGPPDDAPADRDRPVWAGVVPLLHSWGEPVDAPDLGVGLVPPAELATWPQGRA